MNNKNERQTKRYSLPRKEILRTREQIDSLLQNGNRLEGKWCRLFYMQCEERKVVFIVSRRVGNAVRRNKIKRWLRELYRLHRNISGNKIAIAFLITNDKIGLSFQSLKDDILKLLPVIGSKFQL